MKKILVRCKGSRTLRLDDINEFQGGLKSLSEANFARGQASLLKLGFSFPFYVWYGDGDGSGLEKWWCIDGHQRKRILTVSNERDGIAIPKEYPVVEIYASDRREAKEKLLAAIAQYGAVERQGLYEYVTDAQIDIRAMDDTLRFPEVDLSLFATEYLDVDPIKGGTREVSFTAGTENAQGRLDRRQAIECPKCGAEFEPKN